MIPLWLPLCLVAVQAAAHADTDSNAESPSSGLSRRGGKHKSGTAASPKPNTGDVHGVCTVIESPTNPLEGPCVNILLNFKDAGGTEVTSIRTTAQGEFAFTVQPGHSVTIESGSKYYEVVSPSSPLHPGQNVDLKLRQK